MIAVPDEAEAITLVIADVVGAQIQVAESCLPGIIGGLIYQHPAVAIASAILLDI